MERYEESPNCGTAINKIGSHTRATRRQQVELANVEKAIAVLDENPNLEQFIETLSKAGL